MFTKVCIGEDGWIGNGAIVAADVGKGCVIGAGSVVVKAIADYAIAAGNPARVLRYRDGRTASDREAPRGGGRGKGGGISPAAGKGER